MFVFLNFNLMGKTIVYGENFYEWSRYVESNPVEFSRARHVVTPVN